MNMILISSWLCAIMSVNFDMTYAAKGGRGRGKGKKKLMLPFGNVAEYSLVSTEKLDPRQAKIVKGSHFAQGYKLGFKILLICEAKGLPRPTVIWYRDGSEVPVIFPHIHIYEREKPDNITWSKIEIDPATMGDQGIYSCMANNKYGSMAKNMKVEYGT